MTQVTAGFFCEDVRVENNGKLLILGVYTGEIVVPGFPLTSRLVPVLVLDGPPEAEMTMKVICRTEGGAIFADIEAELASSLAGSISGRFPKSALLPSPPFTIQLSSPDRLILEVGINEEPLHTVAEIDVVRGPSP